MNQKSKVVIIGVGIVMSILISGCVEEPLQNSDSINISSSAPFFSVQKNPIDFSMTALLEGELVVDDNGCLRVDDDYDNYLLVWPYGFSLSTEGDVIQVIDDTGKPVAYVGDKVKMGGGGGEMSGGDSWNITEYSAQLPSDRCPGPYWIVGEIVSD